MRQIHEQKLTLGSRKLHISLKVIKMGSTIGHRIDYNGVGALTGQRHIPSKNLPKYPLPGSRLLLPRWSFRIREGSIFYSYSSNSGYHLLRLILLLLLCFWAAVGLFLPRIMCKIYHYFKASALPKTKMSLFLSISEQLTSTDLISADIIQSWSPLAGSEQLAEGFMPIRN